MSRKGNCIDNGATEQVFGHMKDEFFRGRTWPDFESFKADLDAYVAHWNTRRRQVKLKGLTPEEFRSRSLVAPPISRVQEMGGSSFTTGARFFVGYWVGLLFNFHYLSWRIEVVIAEVKVGRSDDNRIT